MRIVVLLPRFPYPPERGDTLRSWTILTGLARRHDLWLACADCTAPTPEQLAYVRTRCRQVTVCVRSGPARLLTGLRGLLAGRSLTEGYFSDPRLAQTVAQWSARVPFDGLLTYSSSVAPVASVIRARRRLLDMCDVDSHKWRCYAAECSFPLRWWLRLEARRVAVLEARAAREHDVCLVVNERERNKFAALLPDVCVEIVPTTVELPSYQAGPPPLDPVIGILGSMSYPPNVRAVNWFGRCVWPLVKRCSPQAKWLIVGRNPVRSVRQWGRQPGVEVAGRVPDVRPYMQRMRVFVDPVRADIGVQSKLLVALAYGRPAVTTQQGAAGLTYSGPPPCLVADSPAEFAAAVVRLLADNELWLRMSRRARHVIELNYTPQRQIETIERVLEGNITPGVAAGRHAEPVLV